MNVGCQSMIAPLQRVIVKRPQEAYRNQQSIQSEFRDLNYPEPQNFEAAVREHEELVNILKNEGVEVLTLPQDDRTGLDSIYTHDPAIVTNHGVILFQTGKKARRGEAAAMEDALTRWNIPVAGRIGDDATAEGGDLVWLDRNTLLAGHGYRTNAAGIRELRHLLDPFAITVLEFHLPHWTGPNDCLHLMSLISLLDSDLAIVYRKLLPVPLVSFLESRKIQLIDVPEQEYETLGCNVLAIAPRRVLLIHGNPATRKTLESAGCTVLEFSGKEICIKGAGGPTCLTRPVLRG